MLFRSVIHIYFPDTGQCVYDQHRAHCKKEKKLMHCRHFLKHVENAILKNKQSVSEAYYEAKKQGYTEKERICVTTLYAYIDSGDLRVKNLDLPEKVGRRQHKKDGVKRKNKKVLGNSIDIRPTMIDERHEFGHWEIDLVIGKRNESDCLLTDRKSTRLNSSHAQ